MAIKRSKAPTGTVVILEHDSRVLRDNPWADPHVRKVAVWLPPHYDQAAGDGRKQTSGTRFPVLYDMVGFTGSGLAHAGWKAFSYNLPERLARLTYEGKMGPAIVVMPDCFTALGGNQYVNSSAVGRYADYLLKEIVPFVDREFRTLASREHRGCFGKSSGGYGAIVHGMKYAAHWGAVADHSGDSYFDFVYWHDWPNTLNELGKHRAKKRTAGKYDAAKEASTGELDQGIDDGRVRRFLKHVWRKEKVTSAEGHCIMNLCMAATYDPDPGVALGFRLPCNLETGERIERRWQRWLGSDPINMVQRYADNLKSLAGIYIDCGWRDQFHIHYGTRILSRRLSDIGIAHRYEEFDDDHSDIDYRMDVSLPFLYRALKP